MATRNTLNAGLSALALSLLLGVAGCDLEPLESLEAPSETRAPADGTALVSWYPPTERTDGSPLLDLAGYRVYFGEDPDRDRYIIEVTNPGQTSQFIDNLDQGTWYFSVTAYDREGFESAKSAPASKTIG
ncbi:MAG TPA: fibronectin type III domain-containing protein [Gammaproteobacteria bacterium]|nr:fibronectin type III domain-containing protein [Gammaproteobacteria bacterium]